MKTVIGGGEQQHSVIQSSSGTASEESRAPPPIRIQHPEIHGREEKHREKEKNTKQERFSLVRKENKLWTSQTDDVIKT